MSDSQPLLFVRDVYNDEVEISRRPTLGDAFARAVGEYLSSDGEFIAIEHDGRTYTDQSPEFRQALYRWDAKRAAELEARAAEPRRLISIEVEVGGTWYRAKTCDESIADTFERDFLELLPQSRIRRS